VRPLVRLAFRKFRAPVVIAPNGQKMRDRIPVPHVLNQRQKLLFRQKGVDRYWWLPSDLRWQSRGVVSHRATEARLSSRRASERRPSANRLSECATACHARL